MKIKKNEIMDYIPIDDTSIAVNNPENGDTHFLEGTAYAIMQEILEGKDSLDALTASLAEKYDAPEDVIRQGEQLRQLMQVYQGEFIDSRHEGYRKLDKLLQLKLRYADFRNPERCVFLFDSHILEGGVELCYCPGDRYVIDDAHVVTAQSDALRLEGLGIDGSGYILCVRVCENWFYVESLLPT